MHDSRMKWIATSVAIAAMTALAGLGSTVASAEPEPAMEEAEPCAQRCHRATRTRGAGFMAQSTDGLELDDQQQALLDAVVEQRSQCGSGRREMRGGGMSDVVASLAEGDLDADEVHARVDERFDEARSEAHAAADAMLAFLDSLDPDQLQQFSEQIEGSPCAQRARRGERGQRGGHGGERGRCAGDCDNGEPCSCCGSREP
jgi:Spy/CpxP family protein refolding chaperone